MTLFTFSINVILKPVVVTCLLRTEPSQSPGSSHFREPAGPAVHAGLGVRGQRRSKAPGPRDPDNSARSPPLGTPPPPPRCRMSHDPRSPPPRACACAARRLCRHFRPGPSWRRRPSRRGEAGAAAAGAEWARSGSAARWRPARGGPSVLGARERRGEGLGPRPAGGGLGGSRGPPCSASEAAAAGSAVPCSLRFPKAALPRMLPGYWNAAGQAPAIFLLPVTPGLPVQV